jgi:hypothetical protein
MIRRLNMKLSSALVGPAVIVLLTAWACSSSNSPAGGNSGSTCTPGQQSPCACPGGGTGVQVCDAAGTSFGICQCTPGNDAGASDSALPSDSSATDSGADGTVTHDLTYCASHCDDLACAALVTCTGTVPAGWVGPVELYEGSDPPPLCDATFSTQVFVGGSQPDAGAGSCPNCQCAPQTALGVCGDGGPQSCPAPVMPPPTWTTQASACQGPTQATGGCTYGNTCSPRPTARFGAKLCIVNTSGNVACPNVAYSVSHNYGRSINDTRACQTQRCIYDYTPGLPNPCVPTPNPNTPTGSVATDSVVTVCCAQ